jgi:hypothetical protein
VTTDCTTIPTTFDGALTPLPFRASTRR